MSNKNLTILGVVTILMVIWAVVQSRVSSIPRSGPEALSYLIPGLDTTGIGSIVVGTGEDSVTLKRRGRDFVVTNKDNYPAVTNKISELITTCLDIKTAELYTDETAYHEDLEVTEEKARSVVKFMTPEPNSTVLAGVATDYIEQELVSVNRDDINSVTVSSPDGDYTLKPKEGSKDITLVNILAGKKAKSSECDSVFNALSNLRFDDVRAQSSGLLFDRRYVCKLNDSTVYTLEIAQKDDKTYVSCTTQYTGEVPKKDMTKVEPEDVLKEKEAKLLAWEKAQKFAAKHKGWKYEIADWKAKDLTKGLSELVEDEEKPEEVKGPEDPNSAGENHPVEPNSV
ncbi:MAG: hypothetical protein ACYS67_14850 [Planctomycetota bacterium]|jgi:hypothetical protein